MRRADSSSGFTLLELLIGSALSALVMAAVLSSFVFLGRNLGHLANYQTLESKGREALTYLRGDIALAQAVKTGTTPTTSTVTLALPAGEVTYTYDGTTGNLRRQATFGANPDLALLHNDLCTCTAFAFSYYTTANGAATSQITASLYVPYSIKQIQIQFTLQTPGTASPSTRATYAVVSARLPIPNKPPPDGT